MAFRAGNCGSFRHKKEKNVIRSKKIILLAGLIVFGFFLLTYIFSIGADHADLKVVVPQSRITLPIPESGTDPGAPPIAESRPENKSFCRKPSHRPDNDSQRPAPEADTLPQKNSAAKEFRQNRFFETLVKKTFPVYTVQTHNPVHPKAFGPPEGEIWVRIKPENAGEMNEIMAEMADLYRDISEQYNKKIIVMQWVGGQPYARKTYFPDGTIK